MLSPLSVMFNVKSNSFLHVMLNANNGRFGSAYFIIVRNLISLPIEWKRPAKVPFYDPWKTGDGVTSLTVDMNKSPVTVEQSNELISADESVKKLFTFHFLGRKYAMRRAKAEMIEMVQSHNYDINSPEVDVARKTASIRNLMEHYKNNSFDKRAKNILNGLIMKRKKRLRLLREWDYKKYEWILEKLDLYYKPYPTEFDPVERKKSIRRLTDKYCDEFKNKKLEEYRGALEDQKEGFLKKKLDALKWMQKEETECGLAITVTDDDIKVAEKQLIEHVEKLKSKPVKIDINRNVLADV